jgi:hypothetical protein
MEFLVTWMRWTAKVVDSIREQWGGGQVAQPANGRAELESALQSLVQNALVLFDILCSCAADTNLPLNYLSILILPFHLRLGLLSGLLPDAFQPEFFTLSHARYMPRPSRPPWFYHPNIWRKVRIMEFLNMRINKDLIISCTNSISWFSDLTFRQIENRYAFLIQMTSLWRRKHSACLRIHWSFRWQILEVTFSFCHCLETVWWFTFCVNGKAAQVI